MKGVTGNVESVSQFFFLVSSKVSMSVSCRKLFPTPTLAFGKLRYIYSMQKCEAQVERESTCALDNHLLRVTIPGAVLIQFDLLRMSKILLETCTCRGL